ncbi:MAG: PH domain-containing protein [Cellulomonas sp.]
MSAPVPGLPALATAPGAPEVPWRRMHPITPVLKGWKALVALLAIVAYNSTDNIRNVGELMQDGRWRYVVAAILGIGALGFAYAAVAWRMTKFVVDDEAVHLHTGVLFRQQRQARLDRLQAVDIVQPLLARLAGLAELKLEVAGGAGSAVSLSFLREADAEALRAELLARAAGLHVRADEEPAAPAPEQPVFEVPMTRILTSTLRSSVTGWFVVFAVVIVVVIVVAHDIAPIVTLVPAMLGVGGALWARVNQGANFRAAISPDGIRLRHGLTEVRAQTVPPGRVQALRFTQGPLWRGPDWWRVEMNVAGYGGEKSQQTENVLLPVGTRAEALLALWLVLPDLQVDDPRALLAAALSGSGEAGGFTSVPRRARWLDLVGWRRRGVLVTDRALFVRSGRIVRRLVVVPHERTQSLALVQGPIQRGLRVASIVVHSTAGPVHPKVEHLDEDVAAALLDEQTERARTARAAAGPEQWMRRPEAS